MFKTKTMQPCRKCKGAGTSNKPATDRDGNTMIADTFEKGEKPRLVMQNCTECKGIGRMLYDSPKEVLQDGEKVTLDDAARRSRFNDTMDAVA
jgi:DnaJ-class molecular chaperone